MQRASPAAALLVAALAGVHGLADGQSLRERVSPANLRFVGVEQQPGIQDRLSTDDLALLAGTREPRTLNDLIAAGIPVRASRIHQLAEWGLLRQEGSAFRSLMPAIDAASRQQLAAILDGVMPQLLDDADAAISRIGGQVWRHPGVPTLPALTAWVLRERVWDHISGTEGLDLRRLIEQQRQFLPDRGFWGVLWYMDEATPPAYGYREGSAGEYTMLIAWNGDERADPYGDADGSVRLQRFLEKLKDGGRKMDDRNELPSALATGLVSESGQVRVLARDYRVNDADEFGYIVEEVAVAIAESVLSHVPRRAVADVLGVSEDAAVVIAYTEIVPRLVAGLAERGLLVRPGDPLALWREGPGDQREGDEGTAEDDIKVTMGEGVSDSEAPLLRYSAMIWRGLPRRNLLRLDWR